MHILSKVIYLFFSLFIATPFVYTQMAIGPQGAPGQFKPQDIDAILNSMTEDDFNNILTELSKLSPQELEELEKIGRQVLIDSGIDPDTGKPLAANQPSIETPSKSIEQAPPIKPIEQKQPVRTQNPENVQIILETIIKEITMLRQKSQGNEQIARRLTQWAEPINDLIFYIKVINKKVHYERLSTQDYDGLFKDLEALSRQLATYQQHILLSEKNIDHDDPYKILGLPYDATEQNITAQFTKLKKKYNPKKIVKKLKAENASQKEIDREKRAAELTLSLVQDAYDQLNDPKTKKLVDEKRLTQPTDQLSSSAQSNLTKVLETLSNSVYQAKLLDQLQDFLKKYEPEQLAQKQAFEQAQTQRKKEQGDLEKTQPKLTYTKFDRTDYPQQLSPSNKYDNFGLGAGFPSFGTTAPTERPNVPLAPIKKDDSEKGGSAGKSSGGAASAPSGSGKASSKTEDDATKNLVKEIEKQNEDKKKKEAAKKQQAMQEKLALYEAQEKAQKELEKRQGKSADKNDPEMQTSTKKRPKIEISQRELVDDVRSNLARLKKEMRKDSSRKLFKQMQFKGTANEPLDKSVIQELNEKLLLPQLEESLDALYDNLPQDTQAQKTIRREWELIAQEYGDALSCLEMHLDQEEKKYTHGEEKKEVISELQNLLSGVRKILVSFNNLSKTILGKFIISTKPECVEFLPIIKPVD